MNQIDKEALRPRGIPTGLVAILLLMVLSAIMLTRCQNQRTTNIYHQYQQPAATPPQKQMLERVEYRLLNRGFCICTNRETICWARFSSTTFRYYEDGDMVVMDRNVNHKIQEGFVAYDRIQNTTEYIPRQQPRFFHLPPATSF